MSRRSNKRLPKQGRGDMQPLFYRFDIERREKNNSITHMYKYGFVRDDAACSKLANEHHKSFGSELIIGVWTCDLRQPEAEYSLLQGRGLGKHGTITRDKADRSLTSAHEQYQSTLKPSRKNKGAPVKKARLTKPEKSKEVDVKKPEYKPFRMFLVYSADSYIKRHLEKQSNAS